MNETVKIKIQHGNNGQNSNFGPNAIDWQFEDGPILPKNEWLWALSIIGFAIIVFSVILKNYLFIIIVALAIFIIYILKNKTPEIHNFKLDDDGINIDGKIYSYENFESFWIFPIHNASRNETGEIEKEIALRNKRHLVPLLIIPFNAEDDQTIRKILSEHLPENEEEESFLDLIKKRFF